MWKEGGLLQRKLQEFLAAVAAVKRGSVDYIQNPRRLENDSGIRIQEAGTLEVLTGVRLSAEDPKAVDTLAIAEHALRSADLPIDVVLPDDASMDDDPAGRVIFVGFSQRKVTSTVEKLDRAIAALPYARTEWRLQQIADRAGEVVDRMVKSRCKSMLAEMPSGIVMLNGRRCLTKAGRKDFLRVVAGELGRVKPLEGYKPLTTSDEVGFAANALAAIVRIEWYQRADSGLLPELDDSIVARLIEKLDVSLREFTTRRKGGFALRALRGRDSSFDAGPIR